MVVVSNMYMHVFFDYWTCLTTILFFFNVLLWFFVVCDVVAAAFAARLIQVVSVYVLFIVEAGRLLC